MAEKLIQSVKEPKAKGASRKKTADELKAPPGQEEAAPKTPEPPKPDKEEGKASVSEDKLRDIIREELAAAREKEKEEADQEKAAEEKDNNRFPMVLKTGAGEEMIAPEEVLRQYMGGTPEGDIELRAIMKFRAAMLMVMDLVSIQKGSAEADAKRMMPILALMKETRDEQDAAAARARASSDEIAVRAAQETAGQLMSSISQNASQTGNSLEEIRQLLSGKKDDPFSRFLTMIGSLQQFTQMLGIKLPGMPGAAAPAQAGEQPLQPQPIERHSVNELEQINPEGKSEGNSV